MLRSYRGKSPRLGQRVYVEDEESHLAEAEKASRT